MIGDYIGLYHSQSPEHTEAREDDIPEYLGTDKVSHLFFDVNLCVLFYHPALAFRWKAQKVFSRVFPKVENPRFLAICE